MTKLPVFDFKKVNVAWGALPIYAFGDDNSVVVTPSADVSTRYVGGDGIPSISMNTDFSGDIAVSLQQQSPTNKNLSDIIYDQRYGSGELAIANFTISDPSGAITVLGKGAYIQSAPEESIGMNTDGKVYTWTFGCEELVWTSDLNGIPEDLLTQYAEDAEGYLSIFAQLRVTL